MRRAQRQIAAVCAQPISSRKSFSKKKASQRHQNAFQTGELGGEHDRDASDVEVKPEDDEEIDSDEAFESGDDDKFNTFKFSGSTKTQKSPSSKFTKPTSTRPKVRDIDLNEGPASADDMTDRSRILTSKSRATTHIAPEENSDEESASDFEDDEGEDLMDLSEMLGRSTDDGNPKSRNEDPSSSPDNRMPGDDTAERVPLATESQFSANESAGDDSFGDSDDSHDEAIDSDSLSSSASDDEEPLDALESFVQQLEQKRKRGSEEMKSGITTSKKRVRAIENNEHSKESEHNLGLPSNGAKLQLGSMMDSLGNSHGKLLRKTHTLNAPLAKPLQDRVNRGAAYDTVKEQITKWQPAVRQLREAAVLKFPLNEPMKIQANNNSLASSFKPANGLEHEIDAILQDSGMQSEKSVAKFEDLEMAKLSVEEVQKRRADLAIMRDLLFRQEQKAKRQSKIKSKAYRRVHRKEREKLKLAMQDSAENDQSTTDKLESARARERMELRHKNTGKWAQKMLSRADHGEGSRAAITQQLQRGEDLERKIRGTERNGNGSVSDSDEDSDAVENNVRSVHVPDNPLPDSGVFSMKFMRDADAREAALLADNSMPPSDHLTGDASNERRMFKPAERQSQHALPTTSAGRPQQGKAIKKAEPVYAISDADTSIPDIDSNPWLSGAVDRKMKPTSASKDSDIGTKFVAKLNKRKRAQHQGKMPSLELNTRKTLPLKDVASDTESVASTDQPARTRTAHGAIVLRQADLVAQAFAGDDVVVEFENSKAADVERDAPRDIDETLPGWGTWTGNGVRKPRNARKFLRHVEGTKVDQRKDAKLQHVVINEKRMKQAKPYMSQSVPYPFESKEQYERSLSNPIGPEFTTRTNFQKRIMPHVVKTQGKVVAPMERPFKD